MSNNRSGEPSLNAWDFTEVGREGRSAYRGGAFFTPVTYESVSLPAAFGQLCQHHGFNPKPSNTNTLGM